MAKRQRKTQRGDMVECPGCGRMGEVIDVYNAEAKRFFILHEMGKIEITGKMTGNKIEIDSIVDACNDGRPTGTLYRD